MQPPRQARLAEVLALLTYAADAGMGLPDEAGVRSAILAAGLGAAVGAAEDDRADAYWVSLLRYAGCTADAHLNAEVLGDEVAVHAEMYGTDYGDPAELIPFVFRVAGKGRALPVRVFEALRTLATMPRLLGTGRAHCEVGDRLAARFGLAGRTREALFQVFERWDGSGLPDRVAGDAIALASRLAAVAAQGEIGHRSGGWEGAAALVRRRAGGMLDPALAEAFARAAPALCAALDGPSLHARFVDAEPGIPREVDEAGVDEALRALGDFADLQSRWTGGHASDVASLARAASERAGLTRSQARLAEWAGWVHDIGRVGVSAGVWDAPRPLTQSEWDRVRLHPHLTERIFARVPPFAVLGEVAGLAHERLDQAGYPRRLPTAALTAPARLLAACDVYAALTADRPHRPALAADPAADQLKALARAGALDPDCVEAVLTAAGHRPRVRAPRPGALSEREVEVTRLLARGLTNKEIGAILGISPKTAGNHVQNIFGKMAVSTRAAATMYAMEHGLL